MTTAPGGTRLSALPVSSSSPAGRASHAQAAGAGIAYRSKSRSDCCSSIVFASA